MPLGLGTALLIGGSALSGVAGNLGSTALQYKYNSNLQEDAQSFNAQEAQLARDFAAQEAATARAFTAEQAQLARDFESTKYQRTIADMKAAGINPASIGINPPSGGSPMASTASGVSSPAASSSFSSVSSPVLGNILSSAFNAAMIESMKDERFTRSLIESTAYHANLIEAKLQNVEAHRYRTDTWHSFKGDRGSRDPDWLKKYVKNFESGVKDL